MSRQIVVLCSHWALVLFLSGCGAPGSSTQPDAATDPDSSTGACVAGTVRTSESACDACAPGEYCAGGDSPREDCAAARSRDADQDPATPCVPYPYVSAGGSGYSCAVTEAGEVVCWGDAPEVPPDLGLAIQVQATGFHTCALLADRTVRCWGSGQFGELDVPATLDDVARLVPGPCAIDSSGELTCWADYLDVPGEAPPSDLGPVEDADRFDGMCAVVVGGSTRCWGLTPGDGLEVPADLAPAVQITAGYLHFCSLSQVGIIRCWGDGGPNGETDSSAITTPARFISTGQNTTCAILDTGYVQCFGYNGHDVATPPADLGTVVQVDVGSGHACAVTTSGAVRCWGNNNDGQATVPRF